MSTTSVAVVYAVMLEYGFNKTVYGKTILAACFITDLGTVLALGFIFAPFDYKTFVFAGVAIAVFAVMPWLTPRLFKRHGDKPSELEAKYLLLILFALGALATWAGSEAVLPAYVLGMLLAGSVGRDHALIRRLRTLTLGLMTPFYFIRAGSYVSIPDLIAAPAAFLLMLVTKVAAKCIGVYPVTRTYGSRHKEGDVHHADDVDRPHLRHDLGAVRLAERHRQPGAIFRAGRRRHRQRRDPHADRQCILPPAASAAQARRGRAGGRLMVGRASLPRPVSS